MTGDAVMVGQLQPGFSSVRGRRSKVPQCLQRGPNRKLAVVSEGRPDSKNGPEVHGHVYLSGGKKKVSLWIFDRQKKTKFTALVFSKDPLQTRFMTYEDTLL